MNSKGFIKISIWAYICIGAAVLFFRFVIGFNWYSVPNISMLPTLGPKTTLFVFQPLICFGMCKPQRGEVWLFLPPNSKSAYVKRVFGIPSDSIEIHGNEVTVNSQPLIEVSSTSVDPKFAEYLLEWEPPITSYTQKRMRLGNTEFDVWTLTNSNVNYSFKVPAESYFFLGDNRPNSNDSRYFPIPYIREDQLIGRVIYIF